MVDLVDKNKCTGCTSCFNICPMGAINMQEEDGKLLYPEINESICIECNMCKNHCPVYLKEEITNRCKDKQVEVYACINNNEQDRMLSSSGGIFTLLANYVLDNKGIVFGVKFDDDLNVVHDFIEKKEDLYKFRGSKYTQSDLKESFKKVRDFLNEGRLVYFSGTPCETNGLKIFLDKDYDNLIIQDCICHGAPAPELLEKYIDYLEKHYSSIYGKEKKIVKFSFRDKENLGWSKYQLRIELDGGNVEYIDHDKSSFMKIFLNDYALRNSCFECFNKGNNLLSDITLGDYWGINNVHEELNDEKGTSLIILNSEKGKELFNIIKDKIKYIESKREYIEKYNPSYISPAKDNEIRKTFLKDLKELSYGDIKDKYIEDSKNFI